MIEIEVGFDGSCPCSNKAIKKEGGNTFTLFPSYGKEKGEKHEAKGKGMHFCIKMVNSTTSSKKVTLKVDWEDKEKNLMVLRDCFYLKEEKEEEYHLIPAQIQGSLCILNFLLPPGRYLLCSSPLYNYSRYERFVKGLRNNKLVKIEKAGESQERRNIWLLKITDESPEERKKRIIILARTHAGEVSGSFSIEGMVEWILSKEPMSQFFLSRFVFYFLPMINPDGVYKGYSHHPRLEGGIEIENVENRLPDRAHETLKTILDRIRPDIYLSHHQWFNKNYDGIYSPNEDFALKFVSYMPDQIEYGKKWYMKIFKKTASELFLIKEGRPCHWVFKRTRYPITRGFYYCPNKFNTLAFILELPWLGRNTKEMRQTGKKVIKAIIFAYFDLSSTVEK